MTDLPNTSVALIEGCAVLIANERATEQIDLSLLITDFERTGGEDQIFELLRDAVERASHRRWTLRKADPELFDKQVKERCFYLVVCSIDNNAGGGDLVTEQDDDMMLLIFAAHETHGIEFPAEPA